VNFPWLLPGSTALAAFVAAAIAFRLGAALVRRLAQREPLWLPFIDAARTPGVWVAAFLAVRAALETAPPALYGIYSVRHFATLAIIGAATWLAVRVAGAIGDVVALRFRTDVADNLRARSVLTQTRVLTRTLASLFVVVGASFALLTFPDVRNIGTGLLASAGVVGLIAGIAARPVLGNLFAGLQIAFTQPIRLDDVLIVEGEWGRVEEIGRAFVTIAIWDQRRLIVPLQYFIEKPFQNWTRSSSEILGTVFLWVDYGMPLEPLRAELQRLVRAEPKWDGRVALIQVTDATERAMQLRVLVSAVDSGQAWDLRCMLRERLLDFVRREYPQFLPRARAELA
jgi:small-conductance mechanosensitive channel